MLGLELCVDSVSASKRTQVFFLKEAKLCCFAFKCYCERVAFCFPCAKYDVPTGVRVAKVGNA